MIAVELLADVCGPCPKEDTGKRMPEALKDLGLVAEFLHRLDTGAFVCEIDQPESKK
jgi:hypothetical protein